MNTLITLDFFPRLFSVLVKEAFIPSICVPPSTVRILLAYPSIVSEYASSHLVKKKLYESPILTKGITNSSQSYYRKLYNPIVRMDL